MNKREKNYELDLGFLGRINMWGLFWLHLLNSDKTKAIIVVESGKTAIIASIAFPEFIWMATGGLNNLKSDDNLAVYLFFISILI